MLANNPFPYEMLCAHSGIKISQEYDLRQALPLVRVWFVFLIDVLGYCIAREVGKLASK